MALCNVLYFNVNILKNAQKNFQKRLMMKLESNSSIPSLKTSSNEWKISSMEKSFTNSLEKFMANLLEKMTPPSQSYFDTQLPGGEIAGRQDE